MTMAESSRDPAATQPADHPAVHESTLAEPAVCLRCFAVFHRGKWLWERVPENAPGHICPACRRVDDNRPAAALTLSGSFVETHRQEVLNAARRVEAGARRQDALQRIIGLEDRDGGILITTTETQLARDIGEALRQTSLPAPPSSVRRFGQVKRLDVRNGDEHVLFVAVVAQRDVVVVNVDQRADVRLDARGRVESNVFAECLLESCFHRVSSLLPMSAAVHNSVFPATRETNPQPA
jgi:hypothetical protein